MELSYAFHAKNVNFFKKMWWFSCVLYVLFFNLRQCSTLLDDYLFIFDI